MRPLRRSALLALALALVLVGISCDNPSGPVRHAASVALEPKLNIAMSAFGGLTVDEAELIAIHGTDSVSRTFPFSPDATQITTELSLPVSDTATYTVTVDLLSTGTLMFTGQVRILVTAGLVAAPVTVVGLTYVGPGLNIDSVRIAPRDSLVAPGGQLPLRIAAYDSSGAPVTRFFIHWATSTAGNVVNAAGLFRAGATKSTVWVYASTPTGVRDSTKLTVGTGLPGVPAAVTKVAGDAQSASVGTAVAVAPQVLVTDAFNSPVAGATVTFAVASGGGSITGASATTGASGLASVGSWTLGAAAGANTLTASVTGLAPVAFTATGTAAGPAIALSVPGALVGIGGSQQVQAVVTLSPAAPAGGVTVTLTSDSTQYITVATPGTIAIPAGGSVGSILLGGVAPGVSVIHATAPGYTASTATATATPNFLSLTYDSVGVGRTAVVGLTLSTPAPAGGVFVGFLSEDTTKFELIDSAMTEPPTQVVVDTIPAGSTHATATVVGLSAGTVPIIAVATNYAYGIEVVVVTPTSSTLAPVSGGGQTGAVNTPLAQPITVRVASATGAPLSGYLVNFTIATGGGSVATVAALTDASGQASTTWTLGPTMGTQTLTVTVAGATGSPLTVTATGQ